MKKLATYAALSLLSVAAVAPSFMTEVSADVDTVFDFKLGMFKGNGQTEDEYRSNTSKHWMVNMQHDTEKGSNSVATYWIENTGLLNRNVSKSYDIHEGSGEHKYSANSDANGALIALTAQNNNLNANEPEVSGYWNPED